MIRKQFEKTVSLSVLCSKMHNMTLRVEPSSAVVSSARNKLWLRPKEQSSKNSNGVAASLGVGFTYSSPDLSLSSRFPVLKEIGIPLSQDRPPIGIINSIIPPVYKDPSQSSLLDIGDPLSPFMKIIEDDPLSKVSRIEKHAARLIVIRRIKMNKHKLKKLRKRMRFVWARVKLKRQTKREKAYLDAKMTQIREAEKFDAKQFVEDCIRRAKEVPIPRKWSDPLMPAWYKEEMMQKEEAENRYRKAVNLYLNRTIDYKPEPQGRYQGPKRKEKK